MIAGTSYLLRGEPVVAVCAWRQQRKTERVHLPLVHTKATTPRNVLIELASGERIVRPFRGLRRNTTNVQHNPTPEGVTP